MAAGDRFSDDPEDRHEWHLDRIRVWLRVAALALLVLVVVYVTGARF